MGRKSKNRDGAGKVTVDDLPPQAQAAVQSLLSEFEQLKAELEETRTKVSELETVAAEDPLVPLLNRRAFLRELKRALAFSRRYEAGMCVAYVDLDQFKQVNDNWGHAVGDDALMTTANTLVANLRESDIVGRLGGDEFALVLWNIELDVAETKAKSLVEALASARFDTPDGPRPVAATIGVVEADPEDDADSVLARADKEMYARKPKKS